MVRERLKKNSHLRRSCQTPYTTSSRHLVVLGAGEGASAVRPLGLPAWAGPASATAKASVAAVVENRMMVRATSAAPREQR